MADKTIHDVYNTLTEAQNKTVQKLVGELLIMTQEQREVVYYLIGAAVHPEKYPNGANTG